MQPKEDRREGAKANKVYYRSSVQLMKSRQLPDLPITFKSLAPAALGGKFNDGGQVATVNLPVSDA